MQEAIDVSCVPLYYTPNDTFVPFYFQIMWTWLISVINELWMILKNESYQIICNVNF